MIDVRSLFADKKITVMGLGLLGRGLKDTIFLSRCGADVTVTDLKTAEQLAPSVRQLEGLPVRLRLGEHHPDDFRNADMILRNADVPATSKFLKIARETGVPIEMDESLFCKYFNGVVVGVTGTRGKTTTTTLIHRMLSGGERRVFLSGNILGCATLPLLAEAHEEDTVVLELSSWQLQGFHQAKISPNASVFTNIYPDHLNRYGGMDEYIHDKLAVFQYQQGSDFCLFNARQAETAQLAQQAPAGVFFFQSEDVPSDWAIRLPGEHNRENIAAAAGLARRLGASPSWIREAAETFAGVEHRLQRLGEKDGVGYINDSTSTTPIAGCVALNAVKAERILLIAGGADKNLDLRPFAAALTEKVHRVALLHGTATPALREHIVEYGGESKITGLFDSLDTAVASLSTQAQAGDVILLSPGCASFGLFNNEFHRGETFMRIAADMGVSSDTGALR